MSGYISKEAAEDLFREARSRLKPQNYKGEEFFIRDEMLLNAQQFIHLIPAADVRPVVRGKWQETEEPMGWTDVACACCSVCGESFVLGEFEFSDLAETFKYCPNCGAEMIGGQNGEM